MSGIGLSISIIRHTHRSVAATIFAVDLLEFGLVYRHPGFRDEIYWCLIVSTITVLKFGEHLIRVCGTFVADQKVGGGVDLPWYQGHPK